VWGVVEPDHVHVDNHLNYVLHVDNGYARDPKPQLYPRVPLCTPVYPCVPLCIPVYPCVPLRTPVYSTVPLCSLCTPCLPLCTPVYPCVLNHLNYVLHVDNGYARDPKPQTL
jgi:hypothetical protein